MNKNMVVTGALFIVIAIILGAFGAHALKAVLSSEEITSFETGVRYQMYHGLALLAIGLNRNLIAQSYRWFCRLIVAGVVLFSGSIYLLSLDSLMGVELKFLGPITPLGGLSLIIGWILFIVQLIKLKKVDE